MDRNRLLAPPVSFFTCVMDFSSRVKAVTGGAVWPGDVDMGQKNSSNVSVWVERMSLPPHPPTEEMSPEEDKEKPDQGPGFTPLTFICAHVHMRHTHDSPFPPPLGASP